MERPSLPNPSSDLLSPQTPELNGEQGHLIVVSNRLPITINKDAAGEYHFKMSSGGLVSALSGCKKSMSFTWIGWPGFFIPPKDRPIVDRRLMEEYSCQAVYLDDDVADRHYNGFSNSILWPLFHYHPGEMNFDEANWLAYRQANMAFAQAILKQLSPGSMVWVQDYHLMLLPMLLRSLVDGPQNDGSATSVELERILDGIEVDEIPPPRVPDIKIGFFLHTPFPSSEIYRCVLPLPAETQCLPRTEFCPCGVRSCSEFCTPTSSDSTHTTTHDISYLRVRVSSRSRPCQMAWSSRGASLTLARSQLELTPRHLLRCVRHITCYGGACALTDTQNLKKESVKKRIEQLQKRFGDVKVIVGVDRLDYIKGVPQKLHALELFLSQHPEWIGKVCLGLFPFVYTS